jgi:diadenosine tetraphosphate (Ap4A) HIT family hydrolase
MTAMQTRLLLAALALGWPALADVSSCACDPAKPETMKRRECSLCAEAERQPDGVEFFYLKDVNPRKPNRGLMLPKRHMEGGHHLADMPAAERARYWQAAIAKAHELWGDKWGLAYNGAQVRTQCHMHIHVGKWITVTETPRFKVVHRVEDFPAPKDVGFWIHPVGNGFHVHLGEMITETVLVR